jgi:hypothetical protein
VYNVDVEVIDKQDDEVFKNIGASFCYCLPPGKGYPWIPTTLWDSDFPATTKSGEPTIHTQSMECSGKAFIVVVVVECGSIVGLQRWWRLGRKE